MMRLGDGRGRDGAGRKGGEREGELLHEVMD